MIIMKKNTKTEKTAYTLVLIMILLQGFYGIFAYLDPSAFSSVRGTELFSAFDADWVIIYGSRTLFITLILGYLLYSRNYKVLMWGALFGSIMPLTDAYLAYESQAQLKVILKHVATIVYLLVTFFILKKVLSQKAS